MLSYTEHNAHPPCRGGPLCCSHRLGFQSLDAEVGLGRAVMFTGIAVSRLARSYVQIGCVRKLCGVVENNHHSTIQFPVSESKIRFLCIHPVKAAGVLLSSFLV